jgi:hypothetical protein
MAQSRRRRDAWWIAQCLPSPPRGGLVVLLLAVNFARLRPPG